MSPFLLESPWKVNQHLEGRRVVRKELRAYLLGVVSEHISCRGERVYGRSGFSLPWLVAVLISRSEERRVGKECPV